MIEKNFLPVGNDMVLQDSNRRSRHRARPPSVRPNQHFLAPTALQGWLPDNDMMIFISTIADLFDLSEKTAKY